MELQRRQHQIIRFLALLALAVSVTYMATRARLRADVTEEGLSQVTEGTLAVIEGIGPERPVTVHAFVSEDVPREYVTVRSRLLNILREMEARGGEGLTVRIVEPTLHSAEAEEAMENFGIMPMQLADRSGGKVESLQVFLGLAFVSGPREEVVPFLDRGLSVEYEVARALRVVTQEEKKVVGILRTDATIMGNFDLQAKRQQPAWQIVDALRKQYDVRSLNPATPVPEDVDVLFVPQLASCSQAELDTVRAYIDEGRPALITIDPMPLFDLRLSPSEEKLPPPGQGGGMFGGGGGPPPQPKGDYKGLLRDVGVEWVDEQILYDNTNPNPVFEQAPRQIVFAHRPGEEGVTEFEGIDPAIDGLSQIVLMYPGELKPAAGYQDKFKPLLSTSRSAGFTQFEDMISRHPLFGVSGPIPPRTQGPVTGQNHTLAARIEAPAAEGEGGHKGRNVVVFGDLDLFGDLFFQMHERGGDIDGDGLDDVRFDNVPFLLNVVDSLAGDDRFIDLRKRRQQFRRLTRLDQETKDARVKRQESIDEANKKAEAELEEAKKALENSVAAIRDRADLDDTTKQIMLKSAEEAENRRLQAKTEKIEREKAKAVTKIESAHRRSVEQIQDQMRVMALLFPPIPALLMGIFIFVRKRLREAEAIPMERRLGVSAAQVKAAREAIASRPAAEPKKTAEPARKAAAAKDDDDDDAADDEGEGEGEEEVKA
jgi:ABC-2 type transport system permease protein